MNDYHHMQLFQLLQLLQPMRENLLPLYLLSHTIFKLNAIAFNFNELKNEILFTCPCLFEPYEYNWPESVDSSTWSPPQAIWRTLRRFNPSWVTTRDNLFSSSIRHPYTKCSSIENEKLAKSIEGPRAKTKNSHYNYNNKKNEVHQGPTSKD